MDRIVGLSGERVCVTYRHSGEEKVIEASHLLEALGRTPNTQGLGLEQAGVKVNERGYIHVDARLKTSAEGVWAVGEVAGSPQFTHIAYDDFRILRENLGGGHRVTTGRLVPFSMFTDPELARVQMFLQGCEPAAQGRLAGAGNGRGARQASRLCDHHEDAQMFVVSAVRRRTSPWSEP